mmetsp:Transcript_19004/g.47063  ORF Transcript_19004/g.47063 Transcript_19004/m.47063 type:complete len:341 (+) Transcript_19004:204-1226(+)|eukprot:CAMPEP_0113630880 /NCGR_PEP_ID=MMETSP0017_2-20120614/16046_1 /TAXON_ID=2856 /ORGANISM="Cylindrotheca closterium" /LENGTH=340 /DNA_ID=CAMNT_0000541365 /DNA_START=165 /DNA_END=1187 /DNA_ORIENTATION=- /assembly_acc=CAM_ASM_000147
MAKETIHGASKKRKKRRWTKEEKRVRNQESSEIRTSGEKSKKQFNERVLQLAEKCASNGKGVRILKKPIHHSDQSENDSSLVVRTVSSSLLQHLEQDDSTLPSLPSLPSLLAPITIVTKPLLICDVNGILCHRVRVDPYPDIPYRESTKKVSGTHVIPRPGLNDFWQFLSQHFCLAIWTSAKPKSAQALVKAIIPDHIQQKLIFVWAQNQCHIQSQDDSDPGDPIDERNAIFVKSLNKVYSRYPLWNSTNTLLIDDSREKIPTRDVGNVLHPPAMNGKQSSDKLSQYDIMDDQDNHEHQMKFFASLVEKLDSRDMNEQLNRQCSISTLLAEESIGRAHAV